MRPKVAAFLAVASCAAFVSESGAQDVTAKMQSWSVALGVSCTHCHLEGQWADGSMPTFAFAGRMQAMVEGLNTGPLKGVGEITCLTCHRGKPIPARLPRESWEKILAAHETEFGGRKNLGLAMSVYSASLGVDCSHCHEPDRALNTKPPKAMVAKMLPIFDEIQKYFDDTRRPVTQCFMCHQGAIKPVR